MERDVGKVRRAGDVHAGKKHLSIKMHGIEL